MLGIIPSSQNSIIANYSVTKSQILLMHYCLVIYTCHSLVYISSNNSCQFNRLQFAKVTGGWIN